MLHKDNQKLMSGLEAIYRDYTVRAYVEPDPLQFLYQYPDPGDREIVGLIAALLAYGRVCQILKSVSWVLAVMGPSPREYVMIAGDREMASDFEGFRHRFNTGSHIRALLLGIRLNLDRYGSLNQAFVQGYSSRDDTILPALSRFVRSLKLGGDTGYLTADPMLNSACKRNHLFLRWMVRSDAVDPGGWTGIPPSRLLVPLDTHMHAVGTMLGFTLRKQADLRTVMEVTAGFRTVCAEDPVRYDFRLTRYGIRKEMDPMDLKARLCRG
ncbi:MAG: TIGR02757 family protein [Pseudomonadota bacterium]